MAVMNHKSRYMKYRDDGVLRKARTYSTWTVASLMAEVFDRNQSVQVDLARDFQSTGALLVNNLASKLTALLFPHSRPFFKISLSDELKATAEDAGLDPNEINSELSRLEMEACRQIFKNASYNQLVIALKHLIVTGN